MFTVQQQVIPGPLTGAREGLLLAVAPKVTPPARPSARPGLVASVSAQLGLTRQPDVSSLRKQVCSEGLGHQSEGLRWPWLPGGVQGSQPESRSESGWPEAASSGVALPSFSCDLSVTLPRAPSKVGGTPHGL